MDQDIKCLMFIICREFIWLFAINCIWDLSNSLCILICLLTFIWVSATVNKSKVIYYIWMKFIKIRQYNLQATKLVNTFRANKHVILSVFLIVLWFQVISMEPILTRVAHNHKLIRLVRLGTIAKIAEIALRILIKFIFIVLLVRV